jgi:hypothetical protein
MPIALQVLVDSRARFERGKVIRYDIKPGLVD